MLNNALSKLSGLRTKMLLVLVFGMLLLFGSVFLIAREYLLIAYQNLEKEQTQLQVKSAISLLNDQVLHLSNAVKDNAHWDDIYQYMVEQNPKFVESTFSNNTLTDLEVNAIFIIDNKGKALLARSLDYKTGKPWHVPDDLTQAVSPGGRLIDPSIPSQFGLYATPEGVFIVSAFDILNTKRTEPRRGTLIMLRLLEKSTIDHIENIVGSKISLDRMRDDELASLSPQFNKNSILVLPTSISKVNGYALVNTINKGTNLVMTMHSDRKIFRQGQFSLKLLYLGSLVAALLLGAFSWLFNKLVLKKLAHLNTSVKQIGQSGNSSNRVTETAGNDELSSLAHGINGMLDQLEVAKQELLYEKERAQVTLASIAEAVITSDTAGNVRFVNTAAEKLTGFKAKDIIGKPLEAIFNLTTVDKTSSVESSWLTNSQSAIDEVMLIDINGLEFILRKSASALHDAEGGVFGTVTVLHDVTALRMMSNKLSMQARFDALTGLPNRYEFDRKAQLAIEDAHNCAHTHCLAFIDLDKFKLVNDTCGHLAGDMFLQQLSQQMQQNLRASDTLARLGGDEFALLLMGCNLSKA